MTDKNDENSRLTQTYNRMMSHLKAALDLSEKDTPPLEQLLHNAKSKLVELEEATLEEAEKVGTYLKRDIEDVANYFAGPEAKELSDWIKFDIEQIETRTLELFSSVADKTKLALFELEQRAAHAHEYHTGEITSIGTLYCASCSQAMHFTTTGHIPPCPKCHRTIFLRDTDAS